VWRFCSANAAPGWRQPEWGMHGPLGRGTHDLHRSRCGRTRDQRLFFFHPGTTGLSKGACPVSPENHICNLEPKQLKSESMVTGDEVMTPSTHCRGRCSTSPERHRRAGALYAGGRCVQDRSLSVRPSLARRIRGENLQHATLMLGLAGDACGTRDRRPQTEKREDVPETVSASRPPASLQQEICARGAQLREQLRAREARPLERSGRPVPAGRGTSGKIPRECSMRILMTDDGETPGGQVES